MDPSLVFDIAGLLFKFLGSPMLKEIKSIWKYEEEIKMLADTVDIIGDVLNDVEGIRFGKESVNKGYNRLREAYLDAEDFLDRVHTFRKKEEVKATQIKEAKAEIIKPNGKGKLSLAYIGMKMKPTIDKGRRFFSSSNQAKYAVGVHTTIKEIRKKLDAISQDQKFGLVEPSSRSEITLTTARATGSCVNATPIIGRDEDKKEIVSLLLKSSVDDGKIPVISIVGIGGMGKTTVAQLVFDYMSWQTSCQFDVKLWVSDSKQYDLKSLLKHILKHFRQKDPSLDNLEEDHLKMRLADVIQGKKFLLVLDDVDNEDPWNWEKLEASLQKGNKRDSRILVTTRSKKVAEVVGSLPDSTYELHGLSEEDCLQLFERYAFQESRAENLVEIGKRIVQKCSGAPLAVKVMGSYLKGKDRHQWELARDNSFADIRDKENQILPILKLSYHALDSTAKQCFSYLAIFPRNVPIHKKLLKIIWMVNVRFRSGGTTEDVCDKSLRILLDRCFLEEREEGFHIGMHDLMHDLAREVAGSDKFIVDWNSKVDLNKLFVEENVRHLFLTTEIGSPFAVLNGKRLRTVILPNHRKWTNLSAIETCPVLRILDVTDSGLRILPDTIGKLIHLRFLNLSNTDLETLPDSITELINLKYLFLTCCRYLTHLPSGMGALVSLEELDLDDCHNLKEVPRGIEKLMKLTKLYLRNCCSLAKMPSGMGALMPVCRPTRFIVGHPESSDCTAQLEELGSLSDLVENLMIELPWNITSKVPAWDGQAFLLNKKSLRKLEIKWQDILDPEEEVPTNSMDILAKLQPPPNLTEFSLDGYQGMAFPPSVPRAFDLQNLVSLCIKNCRRCRYLPSMSRLECLKHLELVDLSSLEYIEENVSAALICLPKLEKLVLRDLPELKAWCKGLVVGVNDDDNTQIQPMLLPSFPLLSFLVVFWCPNFSVPSFLSSFKMSHFKSHLSPYIELVTEYWTLVLSMKEKDSLRLETTGSSCTETASNYLGEAFRAISDQMTHLAIRNCWLNTLPGLQQLTALRHLEIVDCIEFKGEDEEEGEEEESVGDETESTSLHTAHHPHMPCKCLTSLETLTLIGLPKLLRLPKWILFLNSLQELHIEDCFNLRMPKWAPKFFHSKKVGGSAFLFKWSRKEMVPVPSTIGAFIPAKTLDMFIVGHPESFNAQLKALKHFPDDCTYLTIVLPNLTLKGPVEDSEASLLKKESLRYLRIWWPYTQNLEEEVQTTHIDVLGKLQPPPNLHSFTLSEYQGMTFPPWAAEHGFTSVMPNLVYLYIEGCRRCRYLPSMSSLECLKHLELVDLSSLEYIEENVSAAPFCLPKLEKLVLMDLPELKGWCRGNIHSLLLSSFPHLSALEISSCPNLAVPPLLSFAKVSDLESRVEEGLFRQVNVHVDDLMLRLYLWRDDLCLLISKFNATETALSYMAETLRGMSDRLIHLHFWKCSGLTTLPGILQHLSTLRTLTIVECPYFTWEEEEEEKQSVADEIQSTSHDAHISWKGLSSLKSLILKQLPNLVRLPNGIQFLTSLQNLIIDDCDNLLIPECLHNIFPHKKVDGGCSKQFHLVKKEMDGCSSSTSI